MKYAVQYYDGDSWHTIHSYKRESKAIEKLNLYVRKFNNKACFRITPITMGN